MEKITSACAYGAAAFMAWLGRLSPQDMAFIVGTAVGLGTFLVNWYYRRKSYRLLAGCGRCRGVYDELNR